MENDYQLLLKKLNTFIREYYKNLMLRGGVYSLIGLISVLIIFSVSEHFGFFNTSTRGGLFWAYCIISTLVIIKLIIVPGFKMLQLTESLTHEQAAEIIGNHFSEVADKLINILELHKLDRGSSALIDASIDQKIKDIQFAHFNKAIDWNKTFYYARYLIIPCLIMLLFFISGNQRIISDSTLRIINYNQEFTKPAPFYFEIQQDSLWAIENENITINLKISGKERPSNVYLHYEGTSKKMQKLSNSKHRYTFENIRENTHFYFSANEQYSKQYKIIVIDRPEVENFSITIKPPDHTRLKTELLTNVGSITIPEGSLLSWQISTKKADTLQFQLNEQSFMLNASSENNFNIQKFIHVDSKYSISLANTEVSFIDTTYYDIKIIVDAHPFISINKADTNTTAPIIAGLIQDDYGFLDLKLINRIYGIDRDTLWEEEVVISPLIRSQSFLQSLDQAKQLARPGEIIDAYFIVRDNDKKNGYKQTSSEIITLHLPSHKEMKENYVEETTIAKNEISSELDMLEALKEELTAFEKSLIEKDSLDWRDRKKLEDILTKQASFEKKIEHLKTSIKNNFDQLNSMSEPSEELLQKQNELEKLFNEIMSDEIKELYKELNDLKEQINKEDLQEKLKDLQLSNEDLEKELDRNLEILKQVEFDQQLEDLINQLRSLSEMQIKLSEQSDDLEKSALSQKEQMEKFEEIKDEIEKLKSLNEGLENQHDIQNTDTQEEQITEQLKRGSEQLEKGQKKRAAKSQQTASEQLETLANMFTNMKQDNQKEQHYEDMGVLREILENLVYFSLEQEELLLTFQDLDKDDPKYVQLMHRQQALRDAGQIIEDSLFALSKRVPQISSKINREINAIDNKSQSSIDFLRERLTPKAVQDQQFIMTSANNLAVLLSHVLESMQQDMANNLPSTQQCEKPGKGSPKPGDLKKMQQSLNEHLKQMKEKLEKGEQNEMQNEGISKQLVEMLAKQELIRQSLEELRKEMNDKESLNSLEDAIQNMEKIEEDIANKNITIESLNRQKQIMTRLLEVENSMREQGEDDKRESKTATNEYERIVKEVYEKYELEKLQQNEMIKTTPPSLNNYYKNKVDRYFNLMIQ